MNLSFHNRSETLCVLLVIDADMHAENATPDCPQLQKQKRISNDAIKSRCALPSSTCGISNERTRSCHDHCKGVM